MKSLKEMQLSKEEWSSVIGGAMVYGSNTRGPGHIGPSGVTTLVDGEYWGTDYSHGSLFGDSWYDNAVQAQPVEGSIYIMRG